MQRELDIVDRLPQGLPHRLHVPRAGELETFEAELGDAANLLDRRVDVAIRQTGKADLAVGMMAAEISEPVVIDAQHLVGRLGVADP